MHGWLDSLPIDGRKPLAGQKQARAACLPSAGGRASGPAFDLQLMPVGWLSKADGKPSQPERSESLCPGESLFVSPGEICRDFAWVRSDAACRMPGSPVLRGSSRLDSVCTEPAEAVILAAGTLGPEFLPKQRSNLMSL